MSFLFLFPLPLVLALVLFLSGMMCLVYLFLFPLLFPFVVLVFFFAYFSPLRIPSFFFFLSIFLFFLRIVSDLLPFLMPRSLLFRTVHLPFFHRYMSSLFFSLLLLSVGFSSLLLSLSCVLLHVLFFVLLPLILPL